MSATSTFKLPAPGSLYFDFLRTFPVGYPMSMDLAEFDDDESLNDFTVTKVADNEWKGCPFELGTLSTAQLFDCVRASLEGEDTIKVLYGKDPRKVKKEFVRRYLLCHHTHHTLIQSSHVTSYAS